MQQEYVTTRKNIILAFRVADTSLPVWCRHVCLQGGAPQAYSFVYAASAGVNNSVFLAGSVDGSDGWDGHPSSGLDDFAVAKLDADGGFLWAWLVSFVHSTDALMM